MSAATQQQGKSRLGHRDGCPAKPERVESYTQPAPKGQVAHVVRCKDCGESSVTKKEVRDGQG